MRINTSENYLGLALRALDEIIEPELQSSSSKAALEMLKTTLHELGKRETVAPEMLRQVISQGYLLLEKINRQLERNAEQSLRTVESDAYNSLIEQHANLTVDLKIACEHLAILNTTESSALLREAAEWELSYYNNSAELDMLKQPEEICLGKQSLDKASLESYVNSLDLVENKPIVLTDFQALPGGFGKQTYMCAYSQENGVSRELVVRKMDPMPIMAHGACKLDNEYALLRSLPDSYPAPKPIAYAKDWQNIDGDFYIMDRSPGDVPGAFLAGLSDELPEQVFLDLAQYLGELHSLPLQQFEHYASQYELPEVVASDTKACYQTNLKGWAQYMAKEEHLASPYMVWLVDWMEKNVPIDTRPPVLVHGDFNIHNVLVHQGRISCILDWECAGFGAAEQDLAYIKPHISQHIDWQKFVDHYLAHGGREPREDLMNYGMVYAALRTNLAGNKATSNLQSGRNRDLRYAMVELGFTPSFMNLALQNAKV